MRLSKTKKINNMPIYEPPQGGAKFTFAPILDPNSGLTDSGIYLFEVVRTRRNYSITYSKMTADELKYMINLVYDSKFKPKEFKFTCEYLGEKQNFWAYIGSNISYETVIEGKLYKNVNFNISETRRI